MGAAGKRLQVQHSMDGWGLSIDLGMPDQDGAHLPLTPEKIVPRGQAGTSPAGTGRVSTSPY